MSRKNTFAQLSSEAIENAAQNVLNQLSAITVLKIKKRKHGKD